MAYEAGWVGMVVHAVNGTEVSQGKSLHRDDMEEILRRLDKVVKERQGYRFAEGREVGGTYSGSDERGRVWEM